ncbi:MAG: AraC family transcriptional regulator [Myxococcota bacterium]
MSVEFVLNRWEDSEIERFAGSPPEELHLHDRVEIGYAEDAPLVLEGEKWRQTVEPGSAYVVGVGLVHRLAEPRPGPRFCRMYLGWRACSTLLPAPLQEASARQPVLLPRPRAESWWADLNQGWFPARADTPSTPALHEHHPAVMRAMAFLRQNLNRTISLDELGKICQVSKFHLCRVFHKVVGVTPRTYHRHIRLEASRVLLSKGRPSALVAYDLSFSDQSHFIRSFRKQFGMTPGDYVHALGVRVDVVPTITQSAACV